MNYLAHYDRLIDRARDRQIDGYSERHHVVPRCMGGGNEKTNLVRLTAEEHYVAHQLLVKMNPDVPELAGAAMWMSKRCTGNKAYGWLRRRHAAAAGVRMTGHRYWVGRKHTDEWKAKMSALRTGTTMSAEAVEKMAAGHRGKKLSAWHISRIVSANRKPKSPEHRAKIAAAHMGMKLTSEACRKISEANRGRIVTPETRAKMSALKRGKKRGQYVTSRQVVDPIPSSPIDSSAPAIDQSVCVSVRPIASVTARPS